eukprot:gene1950-2128_t
MTTAAYEEVGKRKWAVSLFDCQEYKDFKGESKFLPTFCPSSLICTNVLIGKLITRGYDERKRNLCEMGPLGCGVCICLTPMAFMPVFYLNPVQIAILGCATNWSRGLIKQTYNVEEEVPICFNNWPGFQSNCLIDNLYFGFFFPCAIFQMYESVLLWEEQAKESKKVKEEGKTETDESKTAED